MLRVVRPGGRIALADPDYDTQALDIEDQELARRVLRSRADVLMRNGMLAHRARRDAGQPWSDRHHR